LSQTNNTTTTQTIPSSGKVTLTWKQISHHKTHSTQPTWNQCQKFMWFNYKPVWTLCNSHFLETTELGIKLVLAMNHTTFLMTCKMQYVVLVLGLLICLELVSLHLMTETLCYGVVCLWQRKNS
jgi:hypothetical protein